MKAAKPAPLNRRREKDDCGWVVFNRLDKISIYSDADICREERFKARDEAEAFLEGPATQRPGSARRNETGWLGPIPMVDLSSAGKRRFAGPWLAQCLSFPDMDLDESMEAFLDTVWVDLAFDQIPAVMDALESEGEIPGGPMSDTWAPPILTRSDHKKIQKRLRIYCLPEIEYYLTDCWDFRGIEVDARRRLGHVNPHPSKGLRNRLLAAALDLEAALVTRHPRCSQTDIYRFWTSLQVHCHLAEFCRNHLWDRQQNDGLVESARHRFCRSLGSYAHQLRSPSSAGQIEAALRLSVLAQPLGNAVAVPSHRSQQLARDTSAAKIVSDPAPAQVSKFRVEGEVKGDLKKTHRQNKGDATLLAGKRAVNFKIAEEYLGITERQRQNLVHKGALIVEGKGSNRKITTDSLKAYLPLENPK